jgi:hypothetical protein
MLFKAVIYDLRMNAIVKKYGIFSDSVTCTQFNPRTSQVYFKLNIFIFFMF